MADTQDVIAGEADASAGLGVRAVCSGAHAARDVELFSILDNGDAIEIDLADIQSFGGASVRKTIVQTGLTFHEHAKNCAVSTDPRDPIAVGLRAFGGARLEAHETCLAKVDEILSQKS